MDLRTVFVFTSPRTASNLFMQLFKQHSKLATSSYPFQQAWMWGPEKMCSRDTPEMAALALEPSNDQQATYQSSFDKLLKSCEAEATKGRIPFIKEHVSYIMKPDLVEAEMLTMPATTPRPHYPTPNISFNGPSAPSQSNQSALNPTLLPDHFMESVRPIILIRHPARSIPSGYRVYSSFLGSTADETEFSLGATLRWARLVFGFYHGCSDLNTVSGWPVVIDADDLTENPEAIIAHLCAMIGISKDGVQSTWEPKSEAELAKMPKHHAGFMDTLLLSKGIEKPQELNVEDEKKRWVATWGEDVAARLTSLVEAAMDDYNYLRGYRLKPQ